MSAPLEQEQRQVVPRWRTFKDSVRAGELTNAGPPRELDSADSRAALLVSREAWEGAVSRQSHRLALLIAPEVLVHALETSEFSVADDVVNHVHQNSPDAPQAALDLAAELVRVRQPLKRTEPPVESGPVDIATAKSQVAVLRSRLRANPHNPVGWVDLARAHVITGSAESAAKAMAVALGQGPTNRFILRAAARLYVHQGDPEHALSVLVDAERDAWDPWIVASGLAVAHVAGNRPRSTRAARRLAENAAFSPFERSELRSAIATLELAAGHDKRARKLFSASLEDPHENSVAQAEWASERGPLVRVPKELLATPHSYEARARDAGSRGDWPRALQQGLYWQHAEPFSAEAATHTSYVAGIGMDDFRASLEAADQGLAANPNNAILRNNAAWAAANLGDLGRAARELDRMKALVDERGVQVPYLATRGLVAYRSGDTAQGRVLYQRAVEIARTLPEANQVEPHVLAHFAHEELRAGGTATEGLITQVRGAARGQMGPDLLALLGRLDRLIEAASDEQ